MNKQFAQLQVYQLGGGIAFGLPTTTTPFLVIPSGQATIKPWGNSGFLFENIVTGDVIAFVNDYDDVLDSSDVAYGVDQPSVFTALAAFFFDVAGGGAEAIQLAASDETTALTTGTGKVTFRMPFAMTLTAVRASLTTAQASGTIFTVDINEGGTSVLSTKLTIDNTELTSTTAATPAVISDTALADDAEITIDIDQIGDGTATGLKITLIGTR
jgi:hypothetical protein